MTFHFKGHLNNTPFNIALFDLSPMITNSLTTCYHREIQSTSSYHLKQTQNIRSSQKSLLLPLQAINTKPFFINNRKTAA